MAAAKKKAAPKGAATGPAVEGEQETPTAPPAPAAAPAAPASGTKKPRKKKWNVEEDKIEYVILLNGKNAIRGLATSKEGVTRMLENMPAKEREKAYVFQRTPVELKTKVDIVWK